MIFLIIWFLCGIISACALGYRDFYIEENVMSLKELLLFLAIILFGIISIIFVIVFFIDEYKDAVIFDPKKFKKK